jgi:4-diphosphocytidyl-2C-methyl-D-erythritol kinase
VLLLRPYGAVKASTAAIYAAFDSRDGAYGWHDRRAALTAALAGVRSARHLSALPPNDLASSPLAAALLDAGAFRADVTGAGPLLYGLFHDEAAAATAAARLEPLGESWIARPTC